MRDPFSKGLPGSNFPPGSNVDVGGNLCLGDGKSSPDAMRVGEGGRTLVAYCPAPPRKRSLWERIKRRYL